MSIAHTPGEWRVHLTDDTLVRNGRTSIAAAYSIEGDWTVAAANARLIAAAPDLLDALQGLVALHDSPTRPGDSYASARAAIAKATGEASA